MNSDKEREREGDGEEQKEREDCIIKRLIKLTMLHTIFCEKLYF